MNLKIKVYDTLCELEQFVINDIKADYLDFGEKYDTEENDKELGCVCMQFVPYCTPDPKVLEKYKITECEWSAVCEELKVLSFGCCGWCV